MLALYLLGGLTKMELVAFLFGGSFFIVGLAAPYFGVRQLQNDPTSPKVHLVLSAGLIAISLALTAFTSVSALGLLIVLLPNGVWFVSARRAQSSDTNPPDN